VAVTKRPMSYLPQKFPEYSNYLYLYKFYLNLLFEKKFYLNLYK